MTLVVNEFNFYIELIILSAMQGFTSPCTMAAPSHGYEFKSKCVRAHHTQACLKWGCICFALDSFDWRPCPFAPLTLPFDRWWE